MSDIRELARLVASGRNGKAKRAKYLGIACNVTREKPPQGQIESVYSR